MKHLFTFSFIFFISNFLFSQNYDSPAQSHTFIFEQHKIPQAWSLSTGTLNYPVAVVDNGFSNLHPDLADRFIGGSPNCNGDPAWYHGNQSVAAIAGVPDNGICIAGIAYSTKVGAFCQEENGNATVLSIGNQGYKIITSSGSLTGLNRTTMEQLTNDGVTIVLSQYGFKHEDYHDVPGVIVVGRADQSGSYLEYAPSGDGYIDVLFITDGLWRIIEGSGCDIANDGQGGTSIATPHVAAVVNLMKDVNPCLFPGDIEEILVSEAAISQNLGVHRGGIIDVEATLLAANNFTGIDQVWDQSQNIEYACVSGDLTIESGVNITISGNLKTGNQTILTVESGATLTVTGTIEFGDLAEVRLKRGSKMIVDGGLLTTHECTDQWRGIFVEGNIYKPQQGVFDSNWDLDANAAIRFTNEAFAENARTLVSMDCYYLPHTEKESKFGGYVEAVNSTFSNLLRVAAFMRYRGVDNSKFIGCDIENVNVGFSHWKNHGVTYQSNNFSSYHNQAIYALDASISVTDGNEFNSNLQNSASQSAILLEGTSVNPFTNPTVIGNLQSEPNRFYGGHTSIYCVGIAGKATEIINNTFLGGEVGVWINGSSDYKLFNNDFYGHYIGTFLEATKSIYNVNLQEDNTISYCDNAIVASYNNDNYIFQRNCFDTSQDRDVYVIASGNSSNPFFDVAIINSEIGSEEVAAGNTFTLGPIYGTITTNASQATDVNYHVHPTTQWGNRKYPNDQPSLAYTNIVQDAFTDSDGDCGTINGVGSIDTESDLLCQPPLDSLKRSNYLDSLTMVYQAYLVELESEELYTKTWLELRYKISKLETCINHSLPIGTSKGMNCDSLESVVLRYDSLPLSAKAKILGALFELRCCSKIAPLVDTSNIMVDEIDYQFTLMQSIIFDMECNNVRTFDTKKLDVLKDFGLQSEVPTSGFARSLYHQLTGKQIILEIPDLRTDFRSSNHKIQNVKPAIVCSPNPTTNVYNTCEIIAPYTGVFDLSIYNENSGLIFSKTLSLKENESMNNQFELYSSNKAIILFRDIKSGKLIDHMILIKL